MRLIHLALIALIYLLILTDEGANTILLESTSTLNTSLNNYLLYGYLVVSIFGALLQASWSDFHCRRKTILFAYIAIILSSAVITLYNRSGLSWLAFVALFIKAAFGNALPVGFALLADVTPAKRLRVIFSGAIVAVSAGIWLPIFLRPVASKNSQMSLFFLVVSALVFFTIYFFLKDHHFDDVKFQKNKASLKKFFEFFKKETLLIGVFFLIPVVGFALIYFNFSEISYYQSLLRGELLEKNTYFSQQSLILALGYYVGIFVLVVPDFFMKKSKIQDITWLKIGLYTTLIAVLLTILTLFLKLNSFLYFYVLLPLFSFGYALRDPAIYSALSKACKLEDQGKIFGAFDSSESFSMIISSIIISKTSGLRLELVFLVTAVLYGIAIFFLFLFFKAFKSQKSFKY